MRIFLIVALLFSGIFANDTYIYSKLRYPISSYSQALGGISVLSDVYSTYHNPSLIQSQKRVAVSASMIDNGLNEVAGSFSSPIKNRLGFNFSYLYRGINDIAIYDSDENIIDYQNDMSHFFNVGINYIILSSKSKGKLSAGVGLNFAKEFVSSAEYTEGPIDGFTIGGNYSLKDFEVSASLLNILGKQKWVSEEEQNDETQKDILEYDIPLKGVVAGKYTIINKISIMAQLDLEDTKEDKVKALGRAGVLFNLAPVNISAGYGDERVSLGVGYKHGFLNEKALGIHGAVSMSKEEDVNGGLSLSFEF